MSKTNCANPAQKGYSPNGADTIQSDNLISLSKRAALITPQFSVSSNSFQKEFFNSACLRNNPVKPEGLVSGAALIADPFSQSSLYF